MICPHCQNELETALSHCPECGVRIVRKISGVVRTSTVMIATGDEHSFYRSVQEVPETLRRRLIETTNSANSGMIVIADRAGKEHWTEVVARREPEQTEAVAQAEPTQEPAPAAPPQGFAGLSWAAWAGILLFLGASATAASVFGVFR
jgi:hypothetical protein